MIRGQLKELEPNTDNNCIKFDENFGEFSMK